MQLQPHARPSATLGHTRPESRTRSSREAEPSAGDTDLDAEPRHSGSGSGSGSGSDPHSDPYPDADAPSSSSSSSAGTAPGPAAATVAAQPSADKLAKLTPGCVIPQTRLEIVRWLGEGGMGTVFEVRHLDIDRHFAAKLLHRSESVARARRFRREAKTIGNIGSPWVVEIYDFKALPDGRLMYLMELVDGPTLLARQTELGALELSKLIGLGRQICKGLADAHARGFIHRDIKPENIMLATEPDGRTHVKIVDFGLAGLLAEPHESSRAGTPMYMSPEQCKGEPADARADIYALGVTLYELGTGRLPFVGEDAAGLREAHVQRKPTPPSQIARQTPGAARLPPSFDALVLRCLAKQPEDRFANAREVEAALIELQLELGLRTEWDELPAPAVLEPRRRKLELGLARLRRAHERERLLRSALALALLALVGLSAAIGWWVGARNRAEIIAQRETELAALREQVHEAAQARRWVYPPVSQPDAETAYALLLELEALDLDDADEVGQALRGELAAELLTHADAYWDTPGGRGFAREFYAHVLVFDPEQPRARERAQLSRSAVASLRERAAIGAFEPVELQALAPLTVLAEPDARRRLEALLAIYADADELPTSVAASLDQLIDELERQLPELARAELGSAASGRLREPSPSEAGLAGDSALAGGDAPPTADPVDPPSPADAEHERPRSGSAAGSASATASSERRAEAAELGERGDAAFRSGDRSGAERHYQRAIELDSRCLAALIGLHRIHFDRGEYKDALRYAERALVLRPKRGDLALDVGDSCMKVLDYACARRHYEQAAALGLERATQRLAMLAERLGSSPPAGQDQEAQP